MPDPIRIRSMHPDEAAAVAELIHRSTNAWYRAKFGADIFACPPSDVRVFVETYEALDPGGCLIAEDAATGALAGSCFMHARPTHVSLGIMNVDPDHFGKGVARKLLKRVTDHADELKLPTRLVSSAMNLDSYSLYTRAGFAPYAVFQDMLIEAPPGGLVLDDARAQRARERVRPAARGDVEAILELEHALLGIRRPGDIGYLIDNANGCWHTLVIEDESGAAAGYLASIDHPACRIVGPGVGADDASALALLAAQLEHRAGRTMLVIAPADRPALVGQFYRWGGRNCELHVGQCRPAPAGPSKPGVQGVFLPTFLPETA